MFFVGCDILSLDSYVFLSELLFFLYFFLQQGWWNALGNIPKTIFTAFAAPAGSTAAPAGDPQYRQPGFVALNCGVASLSFKLRGCEVKFLKAIGIIMLGGVASLGLMKLVAVGKLMF